MLESIEGRMIIYAAAEFKVICKIKKKELVEAWLCMNLLSCFSSDDWSD